MTCRRPVARSRRAMSRVRTFVGDDTYSDRPSAAHAEIESRGRAPRSSVGSPPPNVQRRRLPFGSLTASVRPSGEMEVPDTFSGVIGRTVPASGLYSYVRGG